jgi:hypothetical protein
MADAFVIQTAELTAGIVVLERSGVRFYASEPAFNGLDGKLFKNVRAARQAVQQLGRTPESAGPRPSLAQGQAA